MIKSRTYDIELAVKFGLNNAIFLQDLAYWIDFNKSRDTAYRDGKYWTYGTMDSLVDRHPYWTKNQVKHIVDTCRKNGWIQVEQYDKSNYNRRNWYTISDEVWDVLCIKDTSQDLIVDGRNFTHREEDIQPSNNINTDNNNYPKKNDNKNIQNTPFIPLDDFGEELQKTIKDWIEYKKEKNQSYKPTGLKILISKIKEQVYKFGEKQVIEVIQDSMSANYQGITWNKLEQKGGQSYGQSTRSSGQDANSRWGIVPNKLD